MKEQLIGELYILSQNLNWDMFPKTMTKDFSKVAVLRWCNTSGDFCRAQDKQKFLEFRGKVRRLLDMFKSDAYQQQTKNREIRELRLLAVYKDEPQLQNITDKTIEEQRVNKVIDFPWSSSLKILVETLSGILKEHQNATISKDYDYESIVIGRESYEEAKLRLEAEYETSYQGRLLGHKKFKELRAKYPEVTLP